MNRFLPLPILILMTVGCSQHEARVAAAGAEPRVCRGPGRNRCCFRHRRYLPGKRHV